MALTEFESSLNKMGITYVKTEHPNFANHPELPYDLILEINGGKGIDYCYTQFYFLDNNYVGYGTFDN